MIKNMINKLIRKAGSVIGLNPDSLEVIVEKRTRAKLKMILCYKGHPLHCILKAHYAEIVFLSNSDP